MAYCEMNNAMPAYHDDNAALNDQMQAIFNERFLDSFRKDVAAGIENSNKKSFDKKGSIVESLNAQKVTVDGKEYRVKVTDFVFLVEIDDLPGRKVIEELAPVHSLIHVTEG